MAVIFYISFPFLFVMHQSYTFCKTDDNVPFLKMCAKLGKKRIFSLSKFLTLQ